MPRHLQTTASRAPLPPLHGNTEAITCRSRRTAHISLRSCLKRATPPWPSPKAKDRTAKLSRLDESGLARGFEHFNPAFPQVPRRQPRRVPWCQKEPENCSSAAEWIGASRTGAGPRIHSVAGASQTFRAQSLRRAPLESQGRSIETTHRGARCGQANRNLRGTAKGNGSPEDTCAAHLADGLYFSEPERAQPGVGAVPEKRA